MTEYAPSTTGKYPSLIFKTAGVAKIIWRINTTAAIWRENKLRYLSLGIICSSKFSFQKTVRLLEQIMSADKWPRIFPRQMEAVVYVAQALWNADEITHTSLSANCSLRESESEATLPSSFSFARLTWLISSSFSAPLRSRWVCSISICLSLSRIVASRLEMVLDELACSDFTENSWALMLEMEESFSCKSLSRHSH